MRSFYYFSIRSTETIDTCGLSNTTKRVLPPGTWTRKIHSQVILLDIGVIYICYEALTGVSPANRQFLDPPAAYGRVVIRCNNTSARASIATRWTSAVILIYHLRQYELVAPPLGVRRMPHRKDIRNEPRRLYSARKSRTTRCLRPSRTTELVNRGERQIRWSLKGFREDPRGTVIQFSYTLRDREVRLFR